MKHRDQLKENLAGHLATLTDCDLPKLDFDALSRTLQETISWLEGSPQSPDDLATLRADYEARIGGMVKAMAAVRKSPDALAAAVTEIQSLTSLSIPELLTCYRKTAARFRDTFPASYGLLTGPGVNHHMRNYADFK